MDNQTPDWVTVILSGLGGAFASFMGLRRRFSRDTAAIQQDKTETSLMATIIAERDAALRQAKEATEGRLADAKRIARFEALQEAGDRETKRLRDEIFALRLHTRKLTAIIVKLDPQAASLLQLDTMPGDGIDEGTTPPLLRDSQDN